MMERETGIEPATSSLGSWHSTAELLPLRPELNRKIVTSQVGSSSGSPLSGGDRTGNRDGDKQCHGLIASAFVERTRECDDSWILILLASVLPGKLNWFLQGRFLLISAQKAPCAEACQFHSVSPSWPRIWNRPETFLVCRVQSHCRVAARGVFWGLGITVEYHLGPVGMFTYPFRCKND